MSLAVLEFSESGHELAAVDRDQVAGTAASGPHRKRGVVPRGGGGNTREHAPRHRGHGRNPCGAVRFAMHSHVGELRQLARISPQSRAAPTDRLTGDSRQ